MIRGRGKDEGIEGDDILLDVADLRLKREQRRIQDPRLEASDEDFRLVLRPE